MVSLTIAAGVVGVGLLVLLSRWLLPVGGVRGKAAAWLSIAGAAVAPPIMLLISYVLDSLGLTPSVQSSGVWLALAATMAIAVPLEQAALVVVVWPLYRSHGLERTGTAISAGAMAAAGYGLCESIAVAATATSAWVLTTQLANVVLRVCCAALWSSQLASTRARQRHWFPVVWLASVLFGGFMRHIEEGRGPGWQVLTLPMIAAMLLGAWHIRMRLAGEGEAVLPLRGTRLGILVDPHGLGTMRAAWQHAHRPALLHWIVGGALVSFGANIFGFAVGVFVAHWLRIDLSRVNETDVGAMAPLAILAGAVLLSYPVAGYITAKASDADSVFEPGVAALVSILALTTLLSMTAPVTIVLGLVLAPVAFAMACFGAWLGLSPKEQHTTP